MVLVTSANGRIGRLMVKELVKRWFKVRATDINPAADTLLALAFLRGQGCLIDRVMAGECALYKHK